jgi:hypothetical protein
MTTKPLVYVAGAIDYAPLSEMHLQQGAAHQPGYFPDDVEVFCPKCENRYETDVYELMARNWGAVKRAAALVAFVDPAVFSFGTPIEIWEKCKESARRVVIVHVGEGKPGAFVQYLRMQGATVIDQETLASGVDFNSLLQAAVRDALAGGE